MVWIAVVTGAMLLLAPHVAPYLLAAIPAEEQVTTSKVTLEIQKMTCNMCTITVKKSLMKLKGVKDAVVTLQPSQAIVTYDPKECSLKNLVEATGKAGYPSGVQAILKVEKMTCKMCTVTVQKATVTLDPPQAMVIFDPTKVTLKELMEATAKAGYPSQVGEI
jgi:mercuric ion binding protein